MNKNGEARRHGAKLASDNHNGEQLRLESVSRAALCCATDSTSDSTSGERDIPADVWRDWRRALDWPSENVAAWAALREYVDKSISTGRRVRGSDLEAVVGCKDYLSIRGTCSTVAHGITSALARLLWMLNADARHLFEFRTSAFDDCMRKSFGVAPCHRDGCEGEHGAAI